MRWMCCLLVDPRHKVSPRCWSLVGLKPEDAVAFGDGLNDMEMLSYVGFGIAMGNSHKDLLPYADHVTTHVDEEGVRNGLITAGLL